MEFRFNGEHWHFSHNCPKWPTKSFDVIHLDKLPVSFKVCPECQVLSPTIKPPRITFTISAIVDIYFTGGVVDAIHNDFYFEYWSPEKGRRYCSAPIKSLSSYFDLVLRS